MSNQVCRLYEDGTITICRAKKGISKTVWNPDTKQYDKIKRGGKELGCRKKSFELTSRKKRLIKCSAIRQFLTKKNNCIFGTLTFPKKISQSEANKCFSRFVENMKENYKLNSYVAVKENHKSGNPHFHIILDICWIDFRTINKVWNSAMPNGWRYSFNAFTTGRNPVIQNCRQVAGYITKYISKAESKDINPETRIYFISDNVLSNPAIIDYNTLIYLTCKFPYKCVVSDEYSVYFLNGVSCLPEKYVYKPPAKPEKRLKISDGFQPNLNF